MLDQCRPLGPFHKHILGEDIFMKSQKIVATLSCFALFVCFAANVCADEAKEHIVNQTVEHYPNGAYAVITTYCDTTHSRSNTKVGHKVYNYYDNGLAWTFTVPGTFSYNGRSATCTAASYNYDIFNAAWQISSGSANPQGSSAVASGVMQKTLERKFIPKLL